MKKFFRKSIAFLCTLMLFVSLLGGCGSSAETSAEKSAAEYESEISQLQAQIQELQTQLSEYIPSEEAPSQEASDTQEENNGSIEIVEEQASAQNAAPEEESTPTEPAENTDTPSNDNEELKQIVVFGDSLWDSTRDETGIAYLVSKYTGADVYNCAIGGTRASLKATESDIDYENWDSTSLVGMVNAAIGRVDPERFLEGYVAGGVFMNLDFSKTDCFIIAYGLNDYFANTPLNKEGGSSWDPHGYCGALRLAISNLRSYYPNARILLISPTYCQFWKDGYMYTDSNMKDFGSGTLTDYANACRNVAETQKTLFIDGYSTLGINSYTAEDYLEDGIHLTAAGRELYAKAVSSCLKYGKPGEVSGNSVHY